MLKGFIKPIGVVLGGLLFINLSAFAAETDTKKPSEPAKKATTDTSPMKETTASKQKETTPAIETAAPQKKATAETAPKKEPSASAATVNKQESDPNKVLATVNGENITQKEVNRILNRFGNQIDKEQIPAVTKQILDGLITQKLIMQFIKQNKVEASQTDIEAEINKVREDVKSNPNLEGKTLEQVLENHGSSIEELKNDITISLSLEKYFSKDIDDKKIKAYFDQNKSAYDGSEVKASHILVDTRQMKTEAELAQAMEKIKKAKAEIDAGKDFAEVASNYSDCPSAKKGGDLGFFKRKGQMVEPFAVAAFALKEGQVSDPLKTNFGYHIIKVTEIKKGSDVNFDDVKNDVKMDMMSENANVLITQLKQKAKIDIKTGA